METPPPQKTGLGPLAWVGIGCGSLVVLVIIGLVVFSMMFGGKIKQFAEDAAKNPVRAVATTAVTMSAGQIELVKEDDVNKRYTIREKQNGKLTTIYWDEKAKKAVTIPGDFSAIPADAAPANSSEPASPGAVGRGAGQK